jgi:Zn-dependent M28 family amino/carboxypeptidase
MVNLESLKPALLVLVDPSGSTAFWVHSSRLVRPGQGPQSKLLLAVIVDKEATRLFDALPFGATEAKVSLRLNPPLEHRIKLRNVVGILQGSDPSLKDTCVVLSAHYDHLEPAAVGDGDRICNGANDNASGTTAVVELASALNALPQKPKRSIVFAAFFGEEKGMLGSASYVANPPCAVDKTVANVNLEQIGRTDSAEGPVLDKLYLTGFDYSNVGRVFAEAGLRTGVTAARHERYSDSYFRADNINFALRGIPAHSVSVLFRYADYHMPGDHWDKIDYDNMAKVTRTIGMAALMLADSPAAPQWDMNNAKAAPYLEAWRKLQGK